MLATVVVSGIWSDRVGRRRIFVCCSGLIICAAAALLAAWPTGQGAVVAAAVLGVGFGVYTSVDFALLTQVLPQATDRGKDLGILNIANALPQVLAPVIAAPIVTSAGGYPALYGTSAAIGVAGSILVTASNPYRDGTVDLRHRSSIRKGRMAISWYWLGRPQVCKNTAANSGGTTMNRLNGRHTRLVGAVLTGVAGLLIALGMPASAGVGGPAFYIDGQLYRTVGTPTDLSGTGAPASSWDVIYDFGGEQLNVAEAAPGDTDYNGGRWQVHALTFPSGYDAAVATGDLDGDGVLDSAEEVQAALAAGTAVDAGVVKQFECPAIPLPGR
ncbi:MAG TPA: MFS transporter [Pseudonocardiaceae bacterium]